MSDQFLAEIRIFPFHLPPTGWAFCNGQLMPLTQNTAIAAPRLSQRNTAATTVEQAVLALPEAPGLAARGHTLTVGAEIGAVTAIEFLPHGLTLAAAEPVRRGGGSAMVVHRRR